MISSYRKAASQTSSYMHKIPTRHHLNAEHSLITPTHVHMIWPFKVFTIGFPLQSRQKVKCYTSWPAKCILQSTWKRQSAKIMLIKIRPRTLNLVATTRNSCNISTNDTDTFYTIWELCPTLPTEKVATCRSRGQHDTPQPLYVVMAIVHWIYSLQRENTDILQITLRAVWQHWWSVIVQWSTNWFSKDSTIIYRQNLWWCHFEKCLYSQVEGECKYSTQLMQCTMDTVMYSLCRSSFHPAEKIDEEWHTCSKVHNLFSTPHKHATCHNTPTCYSWQ